MRPVQKSNQYYNLTLAPFFVLSNNTRGENASTIPTLAQQPNSAVASDLKKYSHCFEPN